MCVAKAVERRAGAAEEVVGVTEAVAVEVGRRGGLLAMVVVRRRRL